MARSALPVGMTKCSARDSPAVVTGVSNKPLPAKVTMPGMNSANRNFFVTVL